MAIIQVEIAEALWEKFRQTNLSVDAVVVDAIEKAVEKLAVSPSKEEFIQKLIDTGVVTNPDAWSTSFQKRLPSPTDDDDVEVVHEATETYSYGSLASTIVIRNRMRLDENLSSSQVRERLLEHGIVRNPKDWDTPATQRWLQLTEAEQTEFIAEMNSMFLAGSPASTIITENRR